MSQEQQAHARCAIKGCLHQPYSSEDISLPVCVEHSDGTLCIAGGCTKLREGNMDFCAEHDPLPYPPKSKCPMKGCKEESLPDFGFCLAHADTPLNSQADEVEPADVEEQVTVQRRDASPVRPTKNPRTPRKSKSEPRCPPAPRKAPPPPRTSARVVPYHPGDRLLFPTQRLDHKCRCGNDLHYVEADTYSRYQQTWTCKGFCGFQVTSSLPKAVYRLTPLDWSAWLPLEHTLRQLDK